MRPAARPEGFGENTGRDDRRILNLIRLAIFLNAIGWALRAVDDNLAEL